MYLTGQTTDITLIDKSMTKIGNFLKWAIFIVIVFVASFVVYSWGVTVATPYIYEYCTNVDNTTGDKQNDSKLNTSKSQSYGDAYSNERIGVIGTFGDSAGFMNAFFSLLAFTAVVITFMYQNSKDNKSKIDSHRSQFESVFFNMTSTFEQIVSQLTYNDRSTIEGFYTSGNNAIEGNYDPDGNPIAPNPIGTSSAPITNEYKGREVFRYLYCDKLFTPDNGNSSNGIKHLIEDNNEMSLSDIKDNVFDGTLDHYFRYAYRILKYVNESPLIEESERMQYASVFRAQLSCYELLILFINGIETDNNKFKQLIEKYCLFNNIRASYLPATANFKDLYEPKIASEDGNERDGYADNAEHEYAIGAFRKPSERVAVRRLEIFQKVWELRFSRRLEREREL